LEFVDPHLRLRERRSPGAAFLFWTLVLAFYYDWYCYPFKLGSSGTSPTYNDTPGWISAIKYLIFFGLCGRLFLEIVKKGRRIRARRPWYIAAYLSLLLIPLVYGILAECGRFLQTEPFFSLSKIPLERIFEIGIFFIAAILLHVLPSQRINFQPVLTLMNVTLVAYLAFDLLEIGACFWFGRLPAEAYDNSIFVRFGSLMDKPNYFGILTAMFFGFIFSSEWRYRYKILMLILLSIALLLTLSFTAWAAAAVVCVVYPLATRSWATGRFIAASLLGIVVLLSLGGFLWNSEALSLLDTYHQVIESKSGSVDVHLESIDILRKDFSIASVVGLEPSYQGTSAESQYVEIAVTEGALYLLLFMFVMLAGLYRCARLLRRKRTSRELRVVASTAFCFLLAILVAGIGLPVMAMFPLNLLTTLMLGISNSGNLEQAAPPGFGAQTAF
jgi:hypothetical protein